MKKFIFLVTLCSMLIPPWNLVRAQAPPEYFIVRGKLINADLTPKQGNFFIRASLWFGADANDRNTVDMTNALWMEQHQVTLESDGRFEINIGALSHLPVPFSFDTYKFLQLDVKNDSNGGYHTLDPIPTNTSIDRLNLLTIPFKSGQDNLEGRVLGFEGGNIPYLDIQGKLEISTLPDLLTTSLSSLQSKVEEIANRVENSVWQDPVASSQMLPGTSNSKTGEVRYVMAEKELKVFDGVQWEPINKENNDDEVKKDLLTYEDVVMIHQNQSATPGVFYWDSTNKEYFVGLKDGSLKSLFGDTQLPGDEDIIPDISADWVDFRTMDLDLMNIESTPGFTVERNVQYGLRLKSPLDNWKGKSGIAFPDYSLDRHKHNVFEFVFRSGTKRGGGHIRLIDKNQKINQMKVKEFFNKKFYYFMQGGYSIEDLDESSPVHVVEEEEREAEWKSVNTYRVKISVPRNKNQKGRIKIDQVDSNNWDTIIKNIVNRKTKNISKSLKLKPAWFIKKNTDYYLQGMRVFSSVIENEDENKGHNKKTHKKHERGD